MWPSQNIWTLTKKKPERIWENQLSNKNCLHCMNSNGKKPSQFIQFRTFRTVTLVSKFWQPMWYFRCGAYNTKFNRAKKILREHLFILSSLPFSVCNTISSIFAQYKGSFFRRYYSASCQIIQLWWKNHYPWTFFHVANYEFYR